VKIGFRSIDQEMVKGSQSTVDLKSMLEDKSVPDPAWFAQHKEIYEIVFKMLMRLDDDQRAVVILRDIEGMSYAEISHVLEIEIGTVKSRLSRGRQNLRDLLEMVSL